MKYGRWESLNQTKKEGNHLFIKCECECGTIRWVMESSLRLGKSTSCGCKRRETNYKHGYPKDHPLYKCWAGMKYRCNKKGSQNYEIYGARGISYCDEWENFVNFEKWATSTGWEKGLTLERRDNDGNYEPNNCYWATKAEQARNRSSGVLTREIVDEARKLKEQGQSAASIARLFNINYFTMNDALKFKTWK